MFYWFGMIWWGKFELAAIWVIGAYFLLDLASGLLWRSAGAGGGVANFAHVGGVVSGAVLVWALRMKRDSSDVAQVKATQADCRDTNLLSCEELWVLVQGSPEDEELLSQYALKAEAESNPAEVRNAITANPRVVLDRCPEAAINYFTQMNGDPRTLKPTDLLYLGKRAESIGASDSAVKVYEMLTACYPEAPEVQAALYRIATNDFTAAGGDTYYAFRYANATTGYMTGVALEDALVNYVQTQLGGVVTAAMYGAPQGRITIK